MDYLRKKLGSEECVAQVPAFGRVMARALIWKVGRVLGFETEEIKAIAECFLKRPRRTLEMILGDNPNLKELARKDKRIKQLFTVLKTLEGLPYPSLTPSPTVVMADRPLTEYLPLMKWRGGKVLIQFDLKSVKELGLPKLILLEFKDLTIIERTVKMIHETHGKDINLEHLPLDNEKTFGLLKAGDTDGVFELQCSGIKELLRRLQPENFNELMAVLVLYRPGPLEAGMAEQYIAAKHGRRKPAYPHPLLELFLRETYGVLLYQEQIMEIAKRLAGYSPEEADLLRKALARKFPEELSEERRRFVSRALKRGLPLKLAEDIFYFLEKFAGYAFNKSHAASYALLSYQTAYLKAHFPSLYEKAVQSC